jgi:hypothetical protein
MHRTHRPPRGPRPCGVPEVACRPGTHHRGGHGLPWRPRLTPTPPGLFPAQGPGQARMLEGGEVPCHDLDHPGPRPRPRPRTVTAPAAVRLVLPELPEGVARASVAASWQVIRGGDQELLAGAYVAELAAFIDAVRGGTPAAVGGRMPRPRWRSTSAEQLAP